ncbi:MAG TPA: DUF2239 family protein, partial [Polyangiaceae bacterium]|nr:DUF2239 family protein [Polyangiaceae bacterium]
TDPPRTYVAFAGDTLVASGDLRTVIVRAMRGMALHAVDGVLLFDDETGQQLEVSLQGTPEEVLRRTMPSAPPRGRGRPKLGVKSGEVTLLPRQWDWLERQPLGISATLRRLVDEALKREPDEEIRRNAREATHRFMTSMAGNRAGYEEALRALYRKDRKGFERRLSRWPKDVRKHTLKLARASF